MLRLITATLLMLALAAPALAQQPTPASDAVEAQPDDDDDFMFDDDDEADDESQSGESDDPPDDGETKASPDDVDSEVLDEAKQSANDEIDGQVRKSLGIEEIMVTSQRRRSTLQDVPVSVTAFSASEIEAQGIQDIKGISNFTPNLEIRTAFAASNPTLFIRGVGLNDYNANAASSVAVYQDEVYMNFPAGQLFQFFDVQSVEVLRGPQGSLYGRNASAGAIRVQSKEPTEDFDLSGTVSYGRYNDAEIETAIGGPLVDGLVSGRAAFHWRQRDGFRKNLCVFDEPTPVGQCGLVPGGTSSNRANLIPADLPRKLNNINNWAGRAMIRVTPDALDMDWLFNMHGGQNDSQTTSFYLAFNRYLPALDAYQSTNDYPSPGFYSNEEPLEGHYNRVGYESLNTLGGSARGIMHFSDDLSLFSLTSYERANRAVTDDFDSTPLTLSHNDYNDLSWQLIQELRADWNATDNLNFNFGGMYLHGDLVINNLFGGLGGRRDPAGEGGFETPGEAYTQNIDQGNDTFALYGHFYWTFLDDFSLEGGLRYNWERKSFDIESTFIPNSFACNPFDRRRQCDSTSPVPHLSTPEVRPAAITSTEGTWSAPTGDLSLSYRLTEDTNVYGKYSRGWKPGGFNGSVTSSGAGCTPESCPLVEPIRAESVDGFEAGIKSYWFDRRLMVNAALFLQKYQDLQVFVLENTNLTGTPQPKLINANDAQIYGMELDMWARPMVGLDIRTQFGWLESKYLDFTRNFFQTGRRGAGGVPPVIVQKQADFTGNRLQNNPRFSWSGMASYEIPLGETHGYLRPGFSWSFTSLTYFDPTEGKDRTNLGRYQKRWAGNTFLGQPAYWLLDARLSYTTADERLELTAWVRNLADLRYSVEAFSSLEDNGTVQRVIGQPRTFGLTLAFTY